MDNIARASCSADAVSGLGGLGIIDFLANRAGVCVTDVGPAEGEVGSAVSTGASVVSETYATTAATRL